MLVVRDTGGKVHAFLNVCRHRGNRLCRADGGNAASFTCAYHGWTYGNDGRLTGVPYLKEAYHDELDRDRWGLVPVAQLDSYKGLWFATFDPEAPPLRDYLGEMALVSRHLFDRREGGIEVVGDPQMGHAVQLEIPGREFRRRRLSRALEPLSAIDDRVQRRLDRQPEAATGMVSPGNGHVLICIGADRLRRRAAAGDPGL